MPDSYSHPKLGYSLRGRRRRSVHYPRPTLTYQPQSILRIQREPDLSVLSLISSAGPDEPVVACPVKWTCVQYANCSSQLQYGQRCRVFKMYSRLITPNKWSYIYDRDCSLIGQLFTGLPARPLHPACWWVQQGIRLVYVGTWRKWPGCPTHQMRHLGDQRLWQDAEQTPWHNAWQIQWFDLLPYHVW